MATKHATSKRIEFDHVMTRRAVLLAVYLGSLLVTVLTATIGAALLVSATNGLGGFVLVVAGWLAIVSASTTISSRVAGWVLARFEKQAVESADQRTAVLGAKFVSK